MKDNGSVARDTEDRIFKSEDFSKKSLEGQTFSNCSFVSCNFTESVLRNAHLCSCTFTDCNFSLVKVEGCRLQDVRFVTCKIVGVEFFKCDKTFFSSSFRECMIQYCNFAELNLKGAIFRGSKLRECYFTNTCLVNADFRDADLAGTLFHNSDLSKADFSSALQYEIDPRTNVIKKAKFSLPEAVGLLRSFDIVIT